MKSIYLEHANITVNSIEQGMNFFKTAFPEFTLRGGGEANGKKWIHFGTQETYIALNESIEKIQIHKNYNKTGVNHLGFVVSDVESIAKRLLAAGYKRDFPKQVEEFRIRDYFADSDGNEYEFVQYLSELPEQKNKY